MAASEQLRKPAAAVKSILTNHYPHWWLFALSAVSWGALFIAWALSAARGSNLAALGALCGQNIKVSAPVVAGSFLMLCAMVLPLTIGGAKLTAERTLRCRRQRSIALYVLGYLAVWIAAALLVGLPTSWMMSRISPKVAIALCVTLFTAGAAFRWHRRHREASATCHDVQPLPPSGPEADLACLQYGAHHAQACLVTCGLVTAAALLSRYPMGWMTVTSAVGYLERYRLRTASPVPSLIFGLVALCNCVEF